MQTKKGMGVTEIDGKFYATCGMRQIGIYDNLKEAADAYNKHVHKAFTSPVYNEHGEKDFDTNGLTIKEVIIDEAVPILNKELVEYLANQIKQPEMIEEPTPPQPKLMDIE